MSSHPDAANFFMMALSSSMFMPSFHSDFHRLFDLVPLGWSVRCHELQGSPLPLNQPDQVTRPPAEASGLPVPVVVENVAVFVVHAGIQVPAKAVLRQQVILCPGYKGFPVAQLDDGTGPHVFSQKPEPPLVREIVFLLQGMAVLRACPAYQLPEGLFGVGSLLHEGKPLKPGQRKGAGLLFRNQQIPLSLRPLRVVQRPEMPDVPADQAVLRCLRG